MEQRIRYRERLEPPGSYTDMSEHIGDPIPTELSYLDDRIRKGRDQYDTRLTPSSYTLQENAKAKIDFFSGSRETDYPEEVSSIDRAIIGLPAAWLTPLPTDKLLTSDEYVTKLLNKTNPFRPEFDIPVFLGEFTELIGLFKIVGRTLINKIGSSYLNYQFGWKPFLSDLKSASDLVGLLESRVREFESLMKSGGLHRRIRLDHDYKQSMVGPNHILSSAIVYSEGNVYTDTRYEVYGSVRWYPNSEKSISDFPKPGSVQSFQQAVKTVLNLDPKRTSLVTAWELIPFSWLIDYFLDIESYLGARRGYLEVIPRHICISYKTEIRQRYEPILIDFPGSGGGSYNTHNILNRVVYPDGFLGTVNFNSPNVGQLKNILALVASLQRII